MLVLVAVPLVGAAPAQADAGVPVPGGTIEVQGNGPGISLHIPADGRVNGDGFTASVTGYRFAPSVGVGDTAQVAAPGQVLLVFGVSSSETLIGTGNTFGLPGVTASLVINGQSAELPTETYGETGPVYFLASVPAQAKDVALQLTAGGYSQSFSFTKGRREGPQPYVLYASRDNWEVTDDAAQQAFISTPDPTGHFKDAGIALDINSASLSYFSPGGSPQTPSGPNQAWLVLDGTALPQVPSNDTADLPGFYFNYMGTLTTNDVQLKLPHGEPQPSLLADKGGSSDEGSDGGVFGGTYYWAVPASTKVATVTVDFPPKLPAESSFIGSPMMVPVKTPSAAFKFNFTSSYKFSPYRGPNPPPFASSSSSGPSGKSSNSSGSALVPLLVLLVVVLAGYGFYIVRYRRFLPTFVTGRAMSPGERRSRDATSWLNSQPGANAPEGVTNGSEAPRAVTDGDVILLDDTRTSGEGPISNAVSLYPVPQSPSPPPEGAVEVVLCAPVPTVLGWPTGAEPPSSSVLSLLAYLAWHDGKAFSGETLRAKVGIGRANELSTRTIGTYMNQLRRALGPQMLPEASSGAGYRTVGISIDVRRMETYVRTAAASPETAVENLTAALSLVRGEAPLSEVPAEPWGWADVAGGSVLEAISRCTLEAGTKLARTAIEAGDGELAAWAVDQALLIIPCDHELNKLALDAAAMAVEPSALKLAWDEVARRFVSVREAVPDELVEHYQHLRSRRPVTGPRP